MAAVAFAAAPPAVGGEPLSRLLGQTHVHGMAFDRASPGRLLLATHHGLFALDLATLTYERVGTSGDDFMGFSPSPAAPGTAYASGHPATGGNLGIIKTEDGGKTWAPLSPGAGGRPVDFHQMTVSPADPQVLYGIHHGETVQRSRDGGATWEIVGAAPPRVIAIAASARDPMALYAATETGLIASRDGGASWKGALDTRGPVSMVNVGADGIIFAFQLGRGLIRAEEGAPEAPLGWQDIGAGPAPDYFLHFARDPEDPNRMFGVTGKGAMLASADGGRRWTLIARP